MYSNAKNACFKHSNFFKVNDPEEFWWKKKKEEGKEKEEKGEREEKKDFFLPPPQIPILSPQDFFLSSPSPERMVGAKKTKTHTCPLTLNFFYEKKKKEESNK